MSTLQMFRLLGAMAGGILLATGSVGAQNSCTTADRCIARPNFTATITDVRTSGTTQSPYVTFVVRFRNTGTQITRLGYVSRSPIVVDDRGHRYQLNGAIRGLGEIDGSSVDAKFEIAPGDWADARFEFSLYSGGTIVGTRYDLEFAVREIHPVAGNQLRLGNEHVLAWEGLAPPGVAGASAAAAPAPIASAPVRVAPGCESAPRCIDVGPLALQVTRMTSATNGREVIVTTAVKATNTYSVPLILAYQKSTGEMVDDAGNRYQVDGRYRDRVRGIGEVDGTKADPQFVLQPGESGSFSIATSRYFRDEERRGNVYTMDFVLESLAVTASKQITSIREWAVSFPDLTLTTADAAAAAAENAGRGILGGVINRIRGKP